MVEEYVRILVEQLPKYEKVRIPMVSDSQAKEILMKLKAKGLNVKFDNGWFILVKEKPNESTQKSNGNGNKDVEQKPEQNVAQKPEQRPEQNVERKPEQMNKTEVVKENVRLLTAKGSTRICLRIRQDVVDAVITLYNDPNTSSAIRKALYELLKLKGIEIRPEGEEDQPVDADELLKVVGGDKEGK